MNRISKTEKLPLYSTIRHTIWPFFISSLLVQLKILSLPVECNNNFLPKSTERCSGTYENRNQKAVSSCSSVVLIKVSEWDEYDVSTWFCSEVWEMFRCVWKPLIFKENRYWVPIDRERCSYTLPTFQLFDVSLFWCHICVGVKDVFRLELKIPGGKV